MPAGGRSHSGRQLLSRERSFPSCPQSGRPELRICALCSFVGVYGRGRIVETVSRSPSMQSEVLLGGHAFRSISPTRAAESHQASGCRQCQRRVDRAVRAGSADHLSLNHPSTVAVYDFGRTPEGVFYYAMEYLDGINLQDLVEQYGPQPGRRVISILLQVCGSLYEAHCEGLVHRDVKAVNVMFCHRGGERRRPVGATARTKWFASVGRYFSGECQNGALRHTSHSHCRCFESDLGE